MHITLSVIIVNYNGLKYLKGCLDSLMENLKGITNEIIIVDNDSKDNSSNFIEENYPDVILIKSDRNLGFGKANNVGVNIAKGEFLLLINNDTITLSSPAPVLDILNSNPDIGAVGIKMLNENRKYIPSVGIFPTLRNMFEIKRMVTGLPYEFLAGNFSRNYYEVDWLGGAFIILPKKLYAEVGGFDEKFFMYVEDVDLSKKIADKGYKRVFVPTLSYIHFVGFNTKRNPLLIKGYKIYINKHFSGLYRLLLLAVLQINSIVKIIKGRIQTSKTV